MDASKSAKAVKTAISSGGIRCMASTANRYIRQKILIYHLKGKEMEATRLALVNIYGRALLPISLSKRPTDGGKRPGK